MDRPSLLRTFWLDGHKWWALLGPLISLVFWGCKLWGKELSLEGYPYSLGLIPILAGVLIAYYSRWKDSESLQERLRAKISEPIIGSFTEPRRKRGRACRWYTITVENASDVALKGAFVKQHHLLDAEGQVSLENGRPFRLRRDEINQREESHQIAFDIAPRDSAEVIVLGANEEADDPSVCMMYATTPNNWSIVPSVIPRHFCPHELTVVIGAMNSTPIYRKYKFYFDEEGFLKMEAVSGTW